MSLLLNIGLWVSEVRPREDRQSRGAHTERKFLQSEADSIPSNGRGNGRGLESNGRGSAEKLLEDLAWIPCTYSAAHNHL